MEPEHIKFMKMALRCSRRGLGRTSPNPMVGAVAVRNNRVLSTGYHQAYGGPHAEVMALEKGNFQKATLYVTLEPCIHHGNTPPCADLIVRRGIRRMVVASPDPNPRVFQKGIRYCRDHGIEVARGPLEKEVRSLNRHYFTFMEKKRPFVLIRAGVSVDGKLGDRSGCSRWITSSRLRSLSHGMRGEFAAILTGSRSVITDNCRLTIRSGPWKNKKLFRVVLDTHNRLPANLNIFKNQQQFPLVLFSSRKAADRSPRCPLHFFVRQNSEGLAIPEVLAKLYELQINSVLVESGGRLIGSFLDADTADAIVLFTSDSLIGGRESVQLFEGGRLLRRRIELKNRRIVDTGDGYILKADL